MEGITTAMVAFIFVCIIFPRLVRHHAQFYIAFGLIIVMLFFSSLAAIVRSDRFWAFVGGLNGLLQLASLILLVLSTGGLSLGDLAGEFKGAFEALRKGPDADKPVIVPLTGAQPMPRSSEGQAASAVHTIETPPPPPAAGVATAPPPPAARNAPDAGSIPLE
ncbi:MAG TPA: hypothetical protein VH475_03685 [Tepidisphaeraceae bacterium]|jgi:hypothetical protein